MNLPLRMPIDDKRIAIHVENMKVGDAEKIGALFREVVAALPYYNQRAKDSEIAKHTAEDLRQASLLDPSAVLVAWAADIPVGFCISRDDDGTTWLDWFGVDGAYRGCGAGVMLLDALQQRVLDRGSHKIWCDSRTTNVASGKILSRQGYRRICTLEDHWYRQDFILWEKFVG